MIAPLKRHKKNISNNNNNKNNIFFLKKEDKKKLKNFFLFLKEPKQKKKIHKNKEKKLTRQVKAHLQYFGRFLFKVIFFLSYVLLAVFFKCVWIYIYIHAKVTKNKKKTICLLLSLKEC